MRENNGWFWRVNPKSISEGGWLNETAAFLLLNKRPYSITKIFVQPVRHIFWLLEPCYRLNLWERATALHGMNESLIESTVINIQMIILIYININTINNIYNI
jgi:hypothetical protein